MTMRTLPEPAGRRPGAAGSRSGASRLTLLYIVALSAVALLSLAGQAVVRLYFDRQMSDSQVINIAGRQRMLSQRIAKAVLAANRATVPQELAARHRELRNTLALWERCHRGLQEGDAELGLPGANSTEIKRMFADLEPSFRGMFAPATRICEWRAGAKRSMSPYAPRSLHAAARDVAEVMRYEKGFLQGMDGITARYTSEASRRVVQVERIELGLLVVTLCVLLLEGLFVFRPAVRRIREMLAAIQATGAKLEAARDAAESANQAKSRFLAVTSHELRTPLHALLGTAEQLQKTQLSVAQQEGIAIIHDAGKILLALVNDLLDLSRIESGKLELRMQSARIAEVFDHALGMVRPAAMCKGLELSANIGSDVPSAIVTDSLRLGQVLVNLLGNAVKFTPPGGTINVECGLAGASAGMTRLRFTVADTGIGIPPEEQLRIFESFAQVDSAINRSQSGAGLGLAISRRLVELLGGKLELQSEVGRGSRFSFTLTCQVAEGMAWSTEQGAGSKTSDPPLPAPRSNGTILVVDDAAANRYLAETMLRGAGYDVDVVSSGVDVMPSMAAKSYRAMLLDVHLPGMDGFEVAQAVRRFESQAGRCRTPIIALTADTLPETKSRLLAHSFDLVLHKPASEGEVLAAIAAVGDQRSEVGDRRSVCYIGQPASDHSPAPLARLNGNRALFAELAALFIREAASQREVIENSLLDADGRAIWRAVHRLRGQALMFDAAELCEILLEIEADALASHLQLCRERWAEAALRLDSLLKSLAAPRSGIELRRPDEHREVALRT